MKLNEYTDSYYHHPFPNDHCRSDYIIKAAKLWHFYGLTTVCGLNVECYAIDKELCLFVISLGWWSDKSMENIPR